MNLFTAVIVYLLIFWAVLFAVLPWGNKASETPEAGMAGSAPANPRIKQKFLITFIISSLLWAIIAFLIHMEVIDFYEISRQMVAEDSLPNVGGGTVE
jgi:predicted secreted protein